MSHDDFQVRPGRIGSRGRVSNKSARTLVGQIQRVAKRAGYTSLARGKRVKGTGRHARGRIAAQRLRSFATQRRVVIKARVVRDGTGRRLAELARVDGLDASGEYRLSAFSPQTEGTCQ